MNTQEPNSFKPIHKMNKAELLEEVKRLQGELEEQEEEILHPEDSEEIAKLEAERDEWMERLMEKEEEMQKMEAYQKEFESEVKKERKSNEKELSKKERQIKTLSRQLEELKAEDDSAGESLHKSSFRLEFYQQGGSNLNGKIEHLISRKKKTFTGLDHSEIMAFIQKHVAHLLPEEQVEVESVETPEPQPNQKSRSLSSTKPKPAQRPWKGELGGELVFKHKTKKEQLKQIKRAESAQVKIILDTKGRSVDLSGFQWTAELIADSLKGKTYSYSLGKFKGSSIVGKDLDITIFPGALDPGPYRMRAQIELKNRENADAKHPGMYEMSKLIYVY